MGKPLNRIRNGVRIDGNDVNIDGADVEIIIEDGEEHILMGRGTTVPDADAGFAKGCIFIKTDAGNGVKSLYENQGTIASCDFNLIGKITADELGDGLELIKYADVLIPASEIKTLKATPVELVSAPGAGFAIIPTGVNVSLAAGTEVLSESADNLVVKCDSTELIEVETTGFIDQATDQNRYQERAEAVTVPVANKALIITNKGDGEFGGNASDDAELNVRVYYKVVPVL